jgi:hypothetical protein
VKNRGGKNKSAPEAASAGPKLLFGGGILLILLGLYGMVRPNLLMPAKRENVQIGGQNLVMETRRVVQIPRPLSGLLIFCGMGVIFLGLPNR